METKMENKQDKKINNMVRAIQVGNNVAAYKCLEAVIKERVAKKIDQALSENNGK